MMMERAGGVDGVRGFPDEEWIHRAMRSTIEADILNRKEVGGGSGGYGDEEYLLAPSTYDGIAPSAREAIRKVIGEYRIPEELALLLEAEARRCALRVVEIMDPVEYQAVRNACSRMASANHRAPAHEW